MTTPSLGHSPAWDAVAADGAQELSPLADRFARDAVRLAGLSAEAYDLGASWGPTDLGGPRESPDRGGSRPRVIDIGCGAGTVALLASPAASRVEAVDFAPRRIALLARRVEETGIHNITPRVADAQALPYGEGQFDVAIALFSVIFCPDRAKALREVARVLAPNGKAVVGSWGPMAGVPSFEAMFRAMNEEIPGLVGGAVELPLSTPALCHAELSAAGLRDIAVHPCVHRGSAESPHAFWWQNALTSPPIVLLRQAMGDPDFESFSEGVVRRLGETLGQGPVRWDSLAYLTVARK